MEIVHKKEGEISGFAWLSRSLLVTSMFLSQDLESDPKTVSFAKNGTNFGTAYELDSSVKDGLFPHIASKNVQISVNFGTPVWCETPENEGYLPLQDATEEHKVRAPKGPESYAECEAIMMVGLPAAGKTTWAKKHSAQNRDKRFIILGEFEGVVDSAVSRVLRLDRVAENHSDKGPKTTLGGPCTN